MSHGKPMKGGWVPWAAIGMALGIASLVWFSRTTHGDPPPLRDQDTGISAPAPGTTEPTDAPAMELSREPLLEAPSHGIEVTVRGHGTGPLENAVVVGTDTLEDLFRHGPPSFSDGDGVARLARAEPCWLRVQRVGWIPAIIAPTDASWHQHGSTSGVEVTLTPATDLHVTVLGVGRRPLEGATVTLLPRFGDEALRILEDAGDARLVHRLVTSQGVTDAGGRTVLPLDGGEGCRVEVTAPDHCSLRRDLTAGEVHAHGVTIELDEILVAGVRMIPTPVHASVPGERLVVKGITTSRSCSERERKDIATILKKRLGVSGVHWLFTGRDAPGPYPLPAQIRLAPTRGVARDNPADRVSVNFWRPSDLQAAGIVDLQLPDAGPVKPVRIHFVDDQGQPAAPRWDCAWALMSRDSDRWYPPGWLLEDGPDILGSCPLRPRPAQYGFHVPAGRYCVQPLIDDGVSRRAFDPVEFVVGDDERHTVTVPLRVDGGTLSVRVQDGQGRILRRWVMAVRRVERSGPTEWIPCSLDDAGIQSHPFEPGRYSLMICAAFGYESFLTPPVEVQEGKQTCVVIELESSDHAATLVHSAHEPAVTPREGVGGTIVDQRFVETTVAR